MIGFLNLLIYVLIFALIIGVLWWAFNQIPLPPPVKTILTVVIAVICVIFLISLLVGVVPMHPLLRG